MASEPVLGPVGRRRPAGRLERIAARAGFRLVAGVDEVGRGALAGPLVAAAVLFDVHRLPEGLCDSKMLTPEQREVFADQIVRAAHAVSFAVVDSEEIDINGLQPANLAALERAVRGLRPEPEYVISDWFTLEGTGLAHVGLPHADELSAVVAAASIVAKVARDGFMHELDAAHPGYGFAKHKGYRSPAHWASIRALGPSPVHRRSFRGVSSWQPSFGDG